MREEAIVKGLNILAEEVKTLNSQIISELESEAPETTVRAEIRWGLFNYKKEKHQGRTLAYSNFLEELFKDFVSIRHPEQNVDGSQLIDLGEKWEKQGSVSGKAVVLDSIIWVSFIPQEFERKIISRIQNDIEGKESKILTEFVQTLNSLPQDPGPFIDTLAHEMTHLWLIKTTEFGRAYEEMINSIMQSISNGNPAKHDVLRAKNVLRNPEVEAIDEAFAYYVSYVYTGEKKSADDLAFYDRPKTIEWGIEIIIEKAERDNMGLDEVRYMMANVFHNLAHEGQIKENDERRDPRIFFLKEFLPANDKERLRKFKEVSEGELSKSFKDLKTAVKDIESGKLSKRKGHFRSQKSS